jgi:hypothetical protein
MVIVLDAILPYVCQPAQVPNYPDIFGFVELQCFTVTDSSVAKTSPETGREGQ